MVALNFSWGTDLETIVVDIRERLNETESDLPDSVERPRIFKFNPENLPSLIFNLSTATRGIDVRKLAEERVIPQIEKIAGVAQAQLYGGRTAAVLVRLDLESLSKLEIPIMQVLQVFQGENINLPAGSMSLTDRYLLLRTVGEFQSVEDIGLVLVGYRDNVPVFLKDVAGISLDYLPQEEFVRAGGNEGVMVSIRKQPGYNTVTINDEVKTRLRDLRKDLPPSVSIQIQSDQSEAIKQSIGGVANAAWQGGILAVFVLLIFLRNIRSTLIISIVIPVSLIATFSLMKFGGLSLNIVSLMGITLGVGMFVDNAIVVLESIFRSQLKGLPPKEAAVQGTKEVGKAITASTLTTVSVFVPMIFVQGMAGLIFDDLAMTISFALIVSLAAALTLVPSLCARFMRITGKAVARDGVEELSLADLEVSTGDRRLDRTGQRIQGLLYRLDRIYGRIIIWSLRRARWVVTGAVLLLLLSVGSVLLLGMEFLPEADEGEFTVFFETKVGSTFAYTEGKAVEMESIIQENLDADLMSMTTEIGRGGAVTDVGNVGSNVGRISVRLVPKDRRKRSIWTVLNDLEGDFGDRLMDVKYQLQVEGMSSLAASATGDSEPVEIGRAHV